MMTRVAPSTVLERAIAELLSEGLADNASLAELDRLGARLVLQRALEEEATEFLGRARYQWTVEAHGSRNGVRPRRVLTAEGRRGDGNQDTTAGGADHRCRRPWLV